MLLYLDSADEQVIREAVARFPLDGVTTNPTILARDMPEGRTAGAHLRLLRALTAGRTLFVQTTSDDAENMVADAEAIINALGGDINIKIPSTSEGIKAIRMLAEKGIRTTATACYTPMQALMAAKAGAAFVAPYVAHIDALSQDGPSVAGEMAGLFERHGLNTQVLAASFRTVAQVERCFSLGVTAVTVTAGMLEALCAHPGTAQELASFRQNWDARFGGGLRAEL